MWGFSRSRRAVGRAPPPRPFFNGRSPQAKGLEHWFPMVPTYGAVGRGVQDVITRQTVDPIGGAPTVQTSPILGKVFRTSPSATDGECFGTGAAGIALKTNPTQGTISIWARLDGTFNGFDQIVNLQFTSSVFITIGRDVGGDLFARLGDGVAADRKVTFGGAPTAGALTHFAFTYDEAASVSEITYVNGLPVTTNTTGSAMNFAGLLRVGLGGTYTGISTWEGILKDARIYSRVLTPSEVWELYAPQTRWDLWRQPDTRLYLLLSPEIRDVSTGAGRAPPRRPVLNTGSQQARGLVHWWPARPGYNPGRDYITGQLGTASVAEPTVRGTNFGKASLFRQNLSVQTDADFYRVDPFVPKWDQNGPTTISCWVRPDTTTAYGQHVFYPIDDSGGDNRFYIGIDPDVVGANSGKSKTPYLRVVGSGSVIYHLQNTLVKVQLNTWNHLVAVVSATSDEYHLYLNGLEIPYEATFGENNRPGSFDNAFTQIGIGGQPVPVQGGVQGNAFDFRIYNRILTPAEVWEMYVPQSRWDLWRNLGSLSPDRAFRLFKGWLAMPSTFIQPFARAGLLAQIETDLDLFFDDDMNFGETMSHNAIDYQCIFTDTSAGGALGGGQSRDGPTVVLKSSNVDGIITYGDAIEVHGARYTVEGIRPDGTGITELILIPE